MISLKEYMECIDYQISDGHEYLWSCYGYNAHSFDSSNVYDNNNISIIFDKKNQTVYEMSAHDYVNNRAYRWINPEYLESIKKESSTRGVNFRQAWDDVNYVDLETSSDILEKSRCIFKGEPYDTRVEVPIDLEDSELFTLMYMAHEKDITLNTLVRDILIKELNLTDME